MLFTAEELPQVVEQVRDTITALGQDPAQFEIDIRESDNSVRVACYTDDGGFMVRMFADHDWKRLENEIRELFKIGG